MFADFTRPLNANAYSNLPFTFLDQAAQNALANIAAINLIENGDRTARENWQNQQLTNLLRHAQARSGFWRKRLPSRHITHTAAKFVPIQHRQDVATQVKLEGSLVAGDGKTPSSSYASTGSTGVPVKVYISPENSYYNAVRSLAQYFMNGLSLEYDRVRISPPKSLAKLEKDSVTIETSDTWAGPLSKVFRNGSTRTITHQYDDAALIADLAQQTFGYLVSANRYVDVMMQHGGTEFVKSLGVKYWMHFADYRDPEHVGALEGAGIRCLSNYSSGENGPIAFECLKCPGHFHVAHSNVIVECDTSLTASHSGKTLGRLLITHLHSYATPMIRYDIGDFGLLEERCPCGHDGPTISNILGRGKNFLRHPDGRLLHFYLATRTLFEAARFDECRFRQDTVDTIKMEVGGRESLTTDEEAALSSLISRATDPAFKIEIKPVKKIDWSDNPKQLLFSSSVA